MKYFIYKIIFILLITNYQLLIPPSVFAQSFGLSISPPLLRVMIMPGKSITQVYRITNEGDLNSIRISFVAFEPSGELGNINLQLTTDNEQPKPSWLSWFTLQNADITLPGSFPLKHNQTQEIILKIKVPKDAEEKDYYGSLLAGITPGNSIEGKSQSLTSGIIATNILLTVSKDGKPSREGIISEFTAKPPIQIPLPITHYSLLIFDSFDPIPLTLKVTNTGNNLWQSLGSIKIIDPLGKEVEFLELLPQNILAHWERQLFLAGNEEQPAKDIIWQAKGLRFGPYKALATVYLESNDKKIEKTITIWLIPWKAGLGLLICYLILRIISKAVKKNRK
jgi:hypothetical protein